MKTPPRQRIARLVARHLRQLAHGKAAYEKAEIALRDAIKLGATPGEVITIDIGDPTGGDGRRVVIVDNALVLVEKGTVWRPARLPRFLVEDYKDPKPKKTDEVRP